MLALLYFVTYASVLVFAIACAVRAFQYARAPIHLRWELYPVPHGGADRVKHGGSYFEESDWWTRPVHSNPWARFRFMVSEMLLLKGLREFNRSLWLRSFPFHFGLYLLVGTVLLLACGSVLSLLDPALIAGGAGRLLGPVCTAGAAAGLTLAMLGASGLLVRRLTDPALRAYSTPADIFNLAFFLVALGLVSAGLVLRPPSSAGMLALSAGLLTFDTSLPVTPLLASGLISAALLAAYIPLTHMSHFIGKYFTYHSVRWDDAPSRRGGKLETRLAEYLAYRPTWAAAHVGADGEKTWAEIVGSDPAAEPKR
jgi:nitrate reductase gamma subunit